MRAVVLLSILGLLFGCSPYVGYTHISDPTINDRGLDLVCGGVTIEKGLSISGGLCKNLHGGVRGKIDVYKTW